MKHSYLTPTDFAFGVQALPASFLSFPRAALFFIHKSVRSCRHSDNPLPDVRRETGRYTDLPGFKNLEGLTCNVPERDGGCTPVPTVFDNHCHIFIRQTFRTGLQTPSSHSLGTRLTLNLMAVTQSAGTRLQ